MLTKIKKINNIATFKNYSWDLSEENFFDRFNLFYGWNGSGKSTLANIISSVGLEDKNIFRDDSEVILDINGKEEVLKKTNEKKIIDTIIYNEEFVRNNFSFEDGKTNNGILMTEQSKKVQQKELENLKKEIEKLEGVNGKLNVRYKKNGDGGEIGILEGDIEKLLTKARTEVKKEMLTYTDIVPIGINANSYNNYQINSAKSILEGNHCGLSLDGGKSELKAILEDSEKRDTIDEVVYSFDSVVSLKKLLKVISEAKPERDLVDRIVDLTKGEQKELFFWLREGVALHEKETEPIKCKFCENEISDARLSFLGDIFKGNMQILFGNIDSAIKLITENKIPVAPVSLDFYKDLQGEYKTNLEEYNSSKQQLNDEFEKIINELMTKKKDPVFSLRFFSENFSSIVNRFQQAIKNINQVIIKHSKRTKEFESKRKESAYSLEKLIVCKYKDEYSSCNSNLKDKKTLLAEQEIKLNKLRREEKEILSSLTSYGIGAKELQKKLHSFLNRKDILVEVDTEKEGSYTIKRTNGDDGNYLSEGEKNALALVFFLTKLREDGFKPEKSIVVIDDPVSSFDYQNLFQSFGFIKSELQKVMPMQVFIFTHNFQFFKYIQKWFKELAKDDAFTDIKEKNMRHYVVKNIIDNNSRVSCIKTAPKFLLNHESEYNYIFKLIYRKTKEENENDYEKDYILPNVVRKFLECFLSFRVPNKRGLNEQLKQVIKETDEYSPEETVRHRLEKYCHDGSHSLWQRAVNDMDEVLLGEIKDVCVDCMSFVKAVDEKHYTNLETYINENNE